MQSKELRQETRYVLPITERYSYFLHKNIDLYKWNILVT